VGDTSLFTGLSIYGEHTPNTFSEPRGFDLRASVQILMEGYRLDCRGANKGPFAGKMLNNFLKAFPLRVREEAHRIKGMEGYFSEVRMQHSCTVHVHRTRFVPPPDPFLVEGVEMRSTRRME